MKSRQEKEERTSSQMVWFVDSLHNNSESNCILSTFSCNLLGGTKIRALRDNGSQSNFITEDKAKKENFSILDMTIEENGLSNRIKDII